MMDVSRYGRSDRVVADTGLRVSCTDYTSIIMRLACESSEDIEMEKDEWKEGYGRALYSMRDITQRFSSGLP